jgi:DNA polymerase
MDMLEVLKLQLEWGADEALLDAPQDRRASKPPAAAPPPAKPARTVSALPAGPAEAARLAAACTTLEALQTAMAAFTGCALRDTATRMVFADGVENPRVMLIGEAPGAEEDRIGRPFVGAAGQLLDKMLASIGLDRTNVRIANIIPWRPPGNRNPTTSEIDVCLPFLQRQVALIRPECLVLLGAVAAKAMLAEPERNAGIRRQRGTWRNVQILGLDGSIPCLPTYHPAYLLRTPAAKKESWLDLLALREWLESH